MADAGTSSQRRLLTQPSEGASLGKKHSLGPGWSYSIRGNHTLLPDTRMLFNVFDVQPDQSYRDYWLFANLQLSLDR